MSKWLIWTLLEITTFFLLASLLFLWLSHLLKKKTQDAPQKNSTTTEAVAQSKVEKNSDAYKSFIHFLDSQINFAAKAIRPQSEDNHETNRIKLWGTILKAERAILLNQASEEPKLILTRFLASLLYALSTPKLQTANPDELHQDLKKMEDELLQTAELLFVKESLTKNQSLLNDDLRDNIDRATKRLAQLRIKQKEQQRLELEVSELNKKINNLEKNQTENINNDDFKKYKIDLSSTQEPKEKTRNTSFKQISSLNNLADRQKMVIEQLKNEIKRASSNKNSHDTIEAQKVAFTKMERMSTETQTLIVQLEAELKASNFSIASLKQDISIKDTKIAEIEKQLSNKNETAIGNLQTLNVNKKEALLSLQDGLSTAIENQSTDSLKEQEKDTQRLERLLQESETCVALLAQELETAEEVNQELKKKVESLVINSNEHYSQPLQEQKEQNRGLVQITTELKERLLNIATDKDYQELRVNYNKKSLEYDRLQLASSDLEMKYLKTLK